MGMVASGPRQGGAPRLSRGPQAVGYNVSGKSAISSRGVTAQSETQPRQSERTIYRDLVDGGKAIPPELPRPTLGSISKNNAFTGRRLNYQRNSIHWVLPGQCTLLTGGTRYQWPWFRGGHSGSLFTITAIGPKKSQDAQENKTVSAGQCKVLHGICHFFLQRMSSPRAAPVL